MPVYLCLTCKGKLNSAFEFKQQCENSDSTLRELKNKNSSSDSVKQESLDIVVQPDLGIYDNDQYYGDTDSEDDKPLKSRCASNSFTCTYCQKELRTKKGLKIHQRKHTGEKLHVCQICQGKFTKRNHLIRHLKVHDKKDGINYTCDVCDKQLCSSYLLAKHKKEHAETVKTEELVDEPEKIGENSNGVTVDGEQTTGYSKMENGLYECNFCKKLLSTPLGLRTHLRRHTGKNLARCEVSYIKIDFKRGFQKP